MIDTRYTSTNLQVLSWWRLITPELKYDERAIDTNYANVKVLEWWKYSGLVMKYTEKAFDMAMENRRFDAVNWWLTSGLEIKYTDNFRYCVAINDCFMAEIWLMTKLNVCTDGVYNLAIFNNSINMVKILKRYVELQEISIEVLSLLRARNQTSMLTWIENNYTK